MAYTLCEPPLKYIPYGHGLTLNVELCNLLLGKEFLLKAKRIQGKSGNSVLLC